MNKKQILKINNLNVSIHNSLLLKNINLKIKSNENHILLGPNGSGKSTLAKVLAGYSLYKINKGTILFKKQNLLMMSPELRANKGLFLGFQYPIEIPGLTCYDFLFLIYNEKQKILNKFEITSLEFINIILPLLKKLNIKLEFLNRNLNEGFSGGEKKLNEILQMLLLNPILIILDEIDSGLDIDTLKLFYNLNFINEKNSTSSLLITHNMKILEFLKPNYIHIMCNGTIIKTGDISLIKNLEKTGYNPYKKFNF